MSLALERESVQNPLIRYAVEVGWEYVAPEEAVRLRGGEDKPFLQAVLVRQLQRLNPGVVTSVAAAEELLRRLLAVRADIEGNREAWEYLRGLRTVHVAAERRERNVTFLQTEEPAANCWHVSEEFVYRSGARQIRADVVFFVNGLPVLVVETKAATRVEGIAEALEQIRRYHREAPGFMAQVQLYAVTNLVEVRYGPTWRLGQGSVCHWREEGGAGDFESVVKSFLARRRVLQLVSEGIVYARRDGELSKGVLRPHQLRAVEKVCARARDERQRRGLVWHTQGSGKTYTMLTIARRLLADPRLENPTVLLVVDRNELEQQMFGNLEAVGFGRVHVACSKQHLRTLLGEDTRGLIVTMIHKFDDMPANLCTRRNVFVLVDEAHRSTEGDLGNYLMGALPQATFIGFTGTPIDRTAHGKGTFKTFGGDDPRGYLDKYSIREAIEDGATVPLHYQLAPNELVADRETMEREFWKVAELEGVADVDELNRVLERAVTLTSMLKNRERVNQIAAFVAEHFLRYVQPMGYKAFLVGADREACALYKEALDAFLPREASAVVISKGLNDPPHLTRYHLSDEEEQRVRKEFRKAGRDPQILIVTEKLLTGYDAPILYCMYLDKPMRDHVLLQAIARVNRPYESGDGQRKTTGLIVDFVGVFEHLERALAFDSQDVRGIVEGIEVLQARFVELMEEARGSYLQIASGRTGDKALEAILEYFRDVERRRAFYRFFRELEELYEILSPDAFLRPWLSAYERMAEMYGVVRSAYDARAGVDRELLRKTAAIVQEHTHLRAMRESESMYTMGPAALQLLLQQDQPATVKVFNLLKEVRHLAEAEGKGAPFLWSIGARAEEIGRRFAERQIEAQEAVVEVTKLVRQLEEAYAARAQSQLSQEAFAVEWGLRARGFAATDAAMVAGQVDAAITQFPHWRRDTRQEGELRACLYKALMEIGVQNAVELGSVLLEALRGAES